MTNFTDRRFPMTRLRRSRMADWRRRLTQEATLSVNDLIWPIFVAKTAEEATPITTMPGVRRYHLGEVADVVSHAAGLGIPAVAIFPYTNPELKSEDGDEAFNPDNIACRAIRAIKALDLNIGVIADVALDPYTTHGHDGVIRNDEVDNDLSVAQLVKQARALAKAGVDAIAPSDMQDGRVGAIRQMLEDEGHTNTLILAYSAKYASKFYGPFRDAVGSAGNLGRASKSTYQQDCHNIDEALHEVELDLKEGADWVMVKPGMPYLDVVHAVKQTFAVPTYAYQISGEYAMLRWYADQFDRDPCEVFYESLVGFKRAGADGILTYAAIDMAQWLQDNSHDN